MSRGLPLPISQVFRFETVLEALKAIYYVAGLIIPNPATDTELCISSVTLPFY